MSSHQPCTHSEFELLRILLRRHTRDAFEGQIKRDIRRESDRFRERFDGFLFQISVFEQLGGIMYAHDLLVIREAFVAMEFEDVMDVAERDIDRGGDVFKSECRISKGMFVKRKVFYGVNVNIQRR